MSQNNPEQCELAEIIYEKPLSGVFEEVLFGSDLGNTLWIKFSDKNGINEWIGKFGVGGSGAGWVAKFEEPDKFVVSAGGFAYLVDATNQKLISNFKDNNIHESIFDDKRKLIIGADYTELYWIDLNGRVLFSRKISVDGIYCLKIEGNVLSGEAYRNYEKLQNFWFDLDKLEIINWEETTSASSQKKKPWWKFW